jgi:hypothetical protein
LERERGFESLYEVLAGAYLEVARINSAEELARRNRAEFHGHTPAVRPEDRLAEADGTIDHAQHELRQVISALGSGSR